jgi:hypothetical protein
MKKLAAITGSMKKSLLLFVFTVFLGFPVGFVDSAVFNIAAGDVAGLINAIHTANSNGEDDTINLAAGIYSLTAADNVTIDPNGLPVISSNITIRGQGDISTIIQRDQAAPEFRIFFVETGGTLTLDGVTVRGGLIFTGNGGAIFNRGLVNIVNATLSDNGLVFETDGGAIFNIGTMNIADSVITNNFAESFGGIANIGTINITRSTISDNNNGGMSTQGVARIVNSIVAFNTSGGIAGFTGGILNAVGTLEIINSTIANNEAEVAGGISNSLGGTIHITNSTIANNNALFGGGIINEDGVIKLQNTIVALNTESFPGFISSNDCRGEITSLGNNLVGVPANCSFTFLPSDLTGDPGLDTFKHSEDAGKSHFPLLASSQAIDAGNNILCLINPLLATDQLGLPRVGNCDIGAVEFQGKMLVSIDVRPRSDANKINPNSSKDINVAIRSGNGFDATTVDANTVRFGATGTEAVPIHVARRDVDGDGDRDMVLRFQIQDSGIKCGATSAILTGQISNGQSIIGSSPISTVQCERQPQTSVSR